MLKTLAISLVLISFNSFANDKDVFLSQSKSRMKKIEVAQSKAIEVVENLWNIAQAHEVNDHEVAAFYYELAEKYESSTLNEQIETHRLMLSEQSPILAALKTQDQKQILKYKSEINSILTHYQNGELSYKTWFHSKAKLPFHFVQNTCSQSEQEVISHQLSIGFESNQIHPEVDLTLIKSLIKKEEIKVKCLQKKTEYNARENVLSIRSGDSNFNLSSLIKSQLGKN